MGGDVTVDDGQYEYNGLVFGAGTAYLVTSAAGLEGVAVRSGDSPLPRGHGAVPGPHFADVRQPKLTFNLDGSVVGMDLAAQVLANTFAPQLAPLPLTWKRPSRPARLVYARPLLTELPRGAGIRAPKVALTCADPRIYSAAQRTAIVGLHAASSGGIDFGVDYPIDFPAGGSVSDVVASNAGAADAYPLIRFYGPTDGGTLTSVTLTNLTTGEALTITTTVGAGQILTFDGLAHVTGAGTQIVGLDGSSRYGSWQQPRVPLRLPPGDSVLRLTSTGTSTAIQCVLTWNDTWLS